MPTTERVVACSGASAAPPSTGCGTSETIAPATGNRPSSTSTPPAVATHLVPVAVAVAADYCTLALLSDGDAVLVQQRPDKSFRIRTCLQPREYH